MHLAPVYTRTSTAGGGVRSEALFGLYAAERDTLDGPVVRRRLMPFSSYREWPDGRSTTTVLPPLGLTQRTEVGTMSYLVPIYVFFAGPHPTRPGVSNWSLGTIFGLLARRQDEATQLGWFPFIGQFENVLGYEEVSFVAWPFFVRTVRSGRRSLHAPLPFLSFVEGGGEESFRLWPLYGHVEWKGRYERWFWLWPIFHLHRNGLSGGDEVPEVKWMVWPLYGRSRRGTFRSDSVLWPFFGWATDSESGFRAWDGPWPFVRFQWGGPPELPRRRRVWPLWSHFRGDGLEAWNALWPIFHHRIETTSEYTRRGTFVLPFYRGWDRVDGRTAARSSYRLLWPLFERERGIEGRDRTAIGALSPLGRNPFVEYHYAWLWELWSTIETERGRSERALAALWVRERDDAEDRRSLSGLWARRTYTDGDARVSETSLLFGLVRWRSDPRSGTTALAPAFPGPGWPAERAAAPMEGSAEDR